MGYSLPPQPPEQNPKESRRTLIFLSLALFFLIISASVGGILFASSAGFKPSVILAKIKTLTIAREKALQGEDNNRVNMLLLGMGGVGHDGATLTDTIIFASVRPSDKQVAMLSIPRDLQIFTPDQGYRRINTVNAYAERDNPSTGGMAISSAVSKILDQPVHYYLRVDFSAFKEIIDTVGGIEVDVDRAFNDPFYPDDNFEYAPVAFEQGRQHMNGERALQFARSRHGTNGEGNDFARARRQQKILFALKERLLSFDMLLRPKRIKNIMESLEKHIQTNIAFWEGMRLAKLLRDIDTGQIQSAVLDASPQGLLRERNYNGAFVLEPKDGTWSEIRAVAQGLLDGIKIISATEEYESEIPFSPPAPASTSSAPSTASPPSASSTPSAPPVLATPPLIEIQNGTFITGLAARSAARLEVKGFDLVSIGNALARDVKNTTIYDLADGAKAEQFAMLKQELGAVEGSGEPPRVLTKEKLDFLIILGEDAIK